MIIRVNNDEFDIQIGGRVPVAGEQIEIDGFIFEVKQVRWIESKGTRIPVLFCKDTWLAPNDNLRW